MIVKGKGPGIHRAPTELESHLWAKSPLCMLHFSTLCSICLEGICGGSRRGGRGDIL